jgi:hypothetical protein
MVGMTSRFTVEVMDGTALRERREVDAFNFLEAAKVVASRRLEWQRILPGGRERIGPWVLVTQQVSGRTEEFVCL